VKVLLVTLGCRANQYDSEQVAAALRRCGHELVERAVDADAAVFNSCAVTMDAEADLRQQVRRAAREQPALRTVVMGCAASLDRGTIASLPTVARVVPAANVSDVLSALGVEATIDTRSASQTGTRALLRIQDGCDEHCTFCATTLARGANRSRPVGDLVAEASRLASTHPEIVLTGIHIGHYGRDRGSSLGELLEQLVGQVSGVRFRLSSIEATEVDDRLARLLRDIPERLAPHIHAPLQSGSDRLLRRMGRHWYTASSYAAAIERLAPSDAFGLGADVIAGFPGEEESDHAATMALVRSLPFTYLHVFSYSPRPGTAAERLGSAVSPEVVKRRAADLRALGARCAAEHLARRDGGEADVIVLGGGTARSGLTEDYLTAMPSDAGHARGARFRARLERRGAALFARALAT